MITRPAFLSVFLAAAAPFSVLAQTSAQPGPLAPVLQPYIDKHQEAGVVVLVANRDKVLDLEAVGDSSLKTNTPMDVNDLFWIASMSKTLTAAAFMMLVDEGKVSIDDPVEKYLPEFENQQVVDQYNKNDPPHPSPSPILIRQILSHTSGIAVPTAFTKEQVEANDPNQLDKEVADLGAMPLRDDPGTRYEYNNEGINTAGRIIEVISGMPFADFIQQRLFTPLGMKDTTYWPTEKQAARLAHSSQYTADKSALEDVDFYTKGKDGIDALMKRELGTQSVPTNMLMDMGLGTIFAYKYHYAMPAGGVYSTASDLGNFCQMLLDGGVFQGKRLLSEAAVKEMSTIKTGTLFPNKAGGYGLALDLQLAPGGYPSAGSFGHRGARSTHMWIDPKNQLVFVILTERMDPGKAENAMNQDFLKAATEKWGASASPSSQ